MPTKIRLRFFEVLADRLDWSPKRGVVIAYKKGFIGTQTRAFFEKHSGSGGIREVARPQGMSVGKDGKLK